jgi:hypothetical protein
MADLGAGGSCSFVLVLVVGHLAATMKIKLINNDCNSEEKQS